MPRLYHISREGLIVKDERFDELMQIGYAVFGLIFVIFAILGWLLDIELLIWISVIFLLYIPFMICAVVIRYGNKERKLEKRKKERERRLMESKLLRCRSCDKIYERAELDIALTTIPRCPVCDKKLKPAD